MKQKTITKTYRNGKSVFLMEYVIRLKPDIAGKKFLVTEQRASFKDEKLVFFGSKEKAEAFYDDCVTATITS